jgi:hypothetical protein
MGNENVWTRFERLSAHSVIKIDHSPDCWRVDIRRARDEFVVCTGVDLLPAVIEALDQAETRGWHLSGGAGNAG